MATSNMNTRFVSGKAIACAGVLALALVLSACGTGGDYSDSDNAAATALMGGTALMNGYNSGRSGPMPMYNVGGRVTMCSGASGMLQCY